MDGARFANAVAALDCAPKAITWEAGVDSLCFGGTKNGTAAGELVVFFKKELALEFDYRAKQAGQLASKMRFLAAPWAGLLDNGVWLENARRANERAKMLAEKLTAAADCSRCFRERRALSFCACRTNSSRNCTGAAGIFTNLSSPMFIG